MNRSKPSTVVGGGEMKRATSSVVSIAKSDGASDSRSSRSITSEPASTGSACRQFVLIDSVVGATARSDDRLTSACTVERRAIGHLFH